MPTPMFKERVECALPARMMFAITVQEVFGFEENKEAEGLAEIARLRALLKVACFEPLNGLNHKAALILSRQIDRVHAQVMAEYDQHRADKVATAIYYFLKELTDSGYLELWEGSPVAEAAAIYLPMIEHVFEEQKLDASAQKAARRIMQKLQERGYYQ
jgi:valyl-tRNA synthetase